MYRSLDSCDDSVPPEDKLLDIITKIWNILKIKLKMKIVRRVLTVFLVVIVTTVSRGGGPGAGAESPPMYYTVVAPDVVRPNSDYDVAITMVGTSQPVTVTLDVGGNRDSGGFYSENTFVSVEPYITRIAKLNIKDIGPGSYNLTVRGDSTFTFLNSTALKFMQKSRSVLIQSDKAIYKPGHKVHFRVLVLTSHLKPSDLSSIDIYMKDGDGNRVKEWNRVEPVRGVYSDELELSTQPVLGDWEIVVKASGQEFTKQFTVAEYVLPKFEVTVEVPPHVTFKDSKFPVTVRAKYTYGRPVKGEATISMYPRFVSDVLQPVYDPPVHKVIKIDGKGTTEFDAVADLSLNEDYERQILFDVVVKEDLTGREQNSTSSLWVHRHKYKLELDKTSEFFKPGLKYTAFLRLVHHDGIPVTDKTNKIKVRYGYSYDENEYVEEQYPVSDNGVIELNFYPPVNATTLGIEGEYLDVKEWFSTVSPAVSPSNSFIQAILRTRDPMVNEDVEIEVNSTSELTHLTYQVLGRGDVILANSVQVPRGERTARFRFLATSLMAPTAHLVVQYISPEGEVIADGLDIELAGALQNYVKIDAYPNDVEPGASVGITVESKPNSYVGLMGIDQSVILLKKGNDITEENVLDELRTYDSTPGKLKIRGSGVDVERRRRRSLRRANYALRRSRRSLFWWPGSFTAKETFNKAGAVILTNALVHEHTPWLYYRGGFPDMMLEEAMVPMSAVNSVGAPGMSQEPIRVRSEFPESWIWEAFDTGYQGKHTVSKAVPDTITSWVITGFSLDSVYGLGLSESPTKVKVFRPFFVSLDLPYSVMRGESLSIPVVVFNYMSKPVQAEVTLENSGQFEFADFSNDVNDQPKLELFRKKRITIPSNSGATTSFMITPKELGYIDIKVQAKSPLAGDAVVRKLLVKPEGETQYRNKAIFVDLRSKDSFSTNITLDIPVNFVSDSEYVEVSAVGNLLGASLQNLDKLIQIPFGCGEQNMLNFVPNIVILDYLTNSKQLSKAIETKTKRFLNLGFQQELTYKHKNNSYSAFGTADPSGSTWLTAFVAKSFKQARHYIDIDDSAIIGPLEWLADNQASNGSFPEVGAVSHKEMQGGASQGLALTAYVITAFIETQTVTNRFRNTINKGMDYIHRQIRSGDVDTYSVAVASYALHSANHPSKDAAFELLESRAKTKDDMKWWSRENGSDDSKNPNALLPNSIDVR
uniref:TEP1-F n=1 Tax=Lygus hesperus TaxID=30085 RepID=A0A0A9WLH1_LYGHE